MSEFDFPDVGKNYYWVVEPGYTPRYVEVSLVDKRWWGGRTLVFYIEIRLEDDWNKMDLEKVHITVSEEVRKYYSDALESGKQADKIFGKW